MRVLAIETSGLACSIALYEGETCLAARHELVGRGHAERLVPWIAALPKGGRADRIVVGCGPGSFTGVRVGIAAAKGLGLGWGVPVEGVCSLALIAAGAGLGEVTVAVEAGHGELFVQDYKNGVPRNDPASLPPAMAALRHKGQRVVGNGAGQLVVARGFGEAVDAQADARFLLALPDAARFTAVSPIYGREADARPMALKK